MNGFLNFLQDLRVSSPDELTCISPSHVVSDLENIFRGKIKICGRHVLRLSEDIFFGMAVQTNLRSGLIQKEYINCIIFTIFIKFQ